MPFLENPSSELFMELSNEQQALITGGAATEESTNYTRHCTTDENGQLQCTETGDPPPPGLTFRGGTGNGSLYFPKSIQPYVYQFLPGL